MRGIKILNAEFHFTKDKEFEKLSKEQQEKIKKETQIILDTPFILDLVRNVDITDISYDGTTLRYEHRKTGRAKAEIQPTPEEVSTFLKKVSNVKNKNFSDSEVKMNVTLGYLRINAIHERHSTKHHTFAFRVSRPGKVVDSIEEMVHSDNDISKRNITDLLNVLMKANTRIIISGDTGTGKTESQKLLVGFLEDDTQITLVEDTPDSHIKELYPHMDIRSWVTNENFTTSDAVEEGMRNNPDLFIIAEVRGREAASALDAAKTGHGIVTTVHSNGALDTPSRLMPLIRSNPAYAYISDNLLGKDIVKYFPVGIHMEKERINGETHRYIKEIAVFTGYNDGVFDGYYLYRHMYDYDNTNKKYFIKEEFNQLPIEMIRYIKDKKLYHLLPSVYGGAKGDEDNI